MVSPYDFTWPGGVTAHVSQLAHELSNFGHEVQILAPHSPSREGNDATTFVPLGRSVPVPSGGSIARVSLSWWLYRKIRTLLEQESFDIIHLHEPLAPILPLCVLQFSNAVNIGTFHAYYSRQHLYRLSHPIIKRWHQRLHGGIAVSPAALRYVHKTFPMDYKIIPNGIDVDHFADNPTPWPEYQDGKTNILFVGRLEKRKGLKYLLEAYSRLKWDLPNIRLLVVGPGNPDKDSHRILSASNLQDVVFLGRVSYDELTRYYATADIFLRSGHRSRKLRHRAPRSHGLQQTHCRLGHRGIQRRRIPRAARAPSPSPGLRSSGGNSRLSGTQPRPGPPDGSHRAPDGRKIPLEGDHPPG